MPGVRARDLPRTMHPSARERNKVVKHHGWGRRARHGTGKEQEGRTRAQLGLSEAAPRAVRAAVDGRGGGGVVGNRLLARPRKLVMTRSNRHTDLETNCIPRRPSCSRTETPRRRRRPPLTPRAPYEPRKADHSSMRHQRDVTAATLPPFRHGSQQSSIQAVDSTFRTACS